MKVIDILNKIANGEEIPKEIGYSRKCYYLTNNHDIDEFGGAIGMFALNDEIEILDEDYIEDTPKEDKKIKRIEERESGWWPNMVDGNVSTLKQAINEIIDRLNGDE